MSKKLIFRILDHKRRFIYNGLKLAPSKIVGLLGVDAENGTIMVNPNASNSLRIRKPELCYTHIMDANHHIWRVWAEQLHMWGVNDLVATLLEALGPLTTLGAQLDYIGQPLLNWETLDSHLDALAHLLEDSVETRAFIDFLREEN